MKITMVMTAREFNVSSVHEEYDRLERRKWPKTAGERAYQTISGGPSAGLPCGVGSETAWMNLTRWFADKGCSYMIITGILSI